MKIGDILARLPPPPLLPDEPAGPAVLQCPAHGPFAGQWIPSPVKDGQRHWEPVGECAGCRTHARVSRLIQSASISPRFAHCEFRNFVASTKEQKDALSVARDYAENFADVRATGRCLMLIGRPGTGKNHLAVSITKAIAAQGYTALHTTAYEAIKSIRATWDRSEATESEEDVVRRYVEVDLLVIDEVGRTFGSPNEQVHFFEIIDRRYRDIKPTLIISNQSWADVERVLGPATYDRLREGGGTRVVFAGKSYRDG